MNNSQCSYVSCWFVKFWESPLLVINLSSQRCVLRQKFFKRFTNRFVRKQSLSGVSKFPLGPTNLVLKMVSIVVETNKQIITLLDHILCDHKTPIYISTVLCLKHSSIIICHSSIFLFILPLVYCIVLYLFIMLNPIQVIPKKLNSQHAQMRGWDKYFKHASKLISIIKWNTLFLEISNKIKKQTNRLEFKESEHIGILRRMEIMAKSIRSLRKRGSTLTL